MVIASQIIGIVASVLAILGVQLRWKWQILLVGLIANLLNMLAFFLLNGVTSAVAVSLIAVVQCGINGCLYYKGKDCPFFLKIVYLVLFLLSGFSRYAVPLDLLPIAASVLFVCSVCQRDEQKGRVWSALNVSLWILYDLIVDTTAVFGQIVSLISIFIGLYRYRGQSSVKAERAEP